MSNSINLNTFANGALAERIDLDLQRLFENINDPNTDPKKVRKLQITLALKADGNREVVDTSITSKLTTAPAKDIETKIIIGHDGTKVIGKELKSGIPGQTFMTEQGEVAADTGEILAENQNKDNVINFK